MNVQPGHRIFSVGTVLLGPVPHGPALSQSAVNCVGRSTMWPSLISVCRELCWTQYHVAQPYLSVRRTVLGAVPCGPALSQCAENCVGRSTMWSSPISVCRELCCGAQYHVAQPYLSVRRTVLGAVPCGPALSQCAENCAGRSTTLPSPISACRELCWAQYHVAQPYLSVRRTVLWGQYHVALVRTDVSEEFSASFIACVGC
jgi:hypothetical protein